MIDVRHGLLCALLLQASAGPTPGQSIVLQGGVEDAFALPAEPADPSASIVALLAALDDFDETNLDQNVVHTFTGLPCGIIAAQLVFEVRGEGPGAESDGVALGFADSSSVTYASTLAWSRHFGPYSSGGGGIFPDPDPGLQPTAWSASAQQRFVLDLDALPLATGGTISVIETMNQRGFLDVLTGDDSSADFYTLALTLDSSTVYCTAGTSASGCSAQIAAAGTPSASASSGFTLSAATVEGSKDGLFFFGSNGCQANPWGNGTSFQCVVPPVKRAGLLSGVGTPGQCDGTFTQDLNALWCPACPKAHQNPGAGALVQAQLWYRDPQNTSNQTTSLSDAVEFLMAP